MIDVYKPFSDSLFSFDENKHIYTYDNITLPSVSSFIKRFTKPFNVDLMAKRTALKRNVSVEVILKEWDDTRNYACDLGHNMHTYIENDQKKIPQVEPIIGTDLYNRAEAYKKLRDLHLSKLNWLYAELRMFDLEWGLAGTLDALYEKDGKVFMLDWKSNKKFTILTDKAYNNLYWPFNDLPECKLTIYSIQLSMYRLMLERKNIYTTDAGLIHINKNGDVKYYQVLDFRERILNYFNLFGNSFYSKIIK
jgi:ATP-dependent exoDNAse (exonuclease V) beta subunit